MKRRWLYGLLLICPTVAVGEIYVYRDAHGMPHFSDRPRDGAPPLKQPPINRLPAIALPAATPIPAQARTEQHSPYRRVTIRVPAPDAAHPDPSGDLRVEADSEPAKLSSHHYRLRLNGQPQAAGLQLHNLDRGSHRLAVEIIDSEGRVLAASVEQTIHIQRPSLLHKRRPRPCKANAEDVQRPECQLPAHQ